MQRISHKMPNSVLEALGGHGEVQRMIEQITPEFVQGLHDSGQAKNVFKYINETKMMSSDRHWMQINEEVYAVMKLHFNRKTSEVIFVWIRACLNKRREQADV